ncbi:Ig-like domain-containing protein [Paenibacillus rhizoplanae]
MQGVAVYDNEITVDRWKTVKLRTAVLPWNADHPALTFTSADPAIAAVDGAGNVTGQSVGSTVITVASAENPLLTATVTVHVEAGDGVMDFTDFESGANGWLQDANRSIEKLGTNRWYKILNGASSLSAKNFSEYELSFRLKTPGGDGGIMRPSTSSTARPGAAPAGSATRPGRTEALRGCCTIRPGRC